MVVEDTIPAVEVNQVRGYPLAHQNMLMVTHDGHPAYSLMPKQPPLTPSLRRPCVVFRGVLDTVLYPPPWLPPDSARLQWNVGIPFGIRRNGRNVAFLWILPDSTGF